MSLVLHANRSSPLCHKVLMAFEETDIRYTLNLLDLTGPVAYAPALPEWPLAWLPILEDDARGVVVPDASAIIEYTDVFYNTGSRLVPFNPLEAWEQRRHDRFYDFRVLAPVQTILAAQLRSAAESGAAAVSHARAQLRTALDIVDRDMASRTWAIGSPFGLADCAAAPALWYANLVMPFERTHRNAAGYLDRLRKRLSFRRTIEGVEPVLEALSA